MLTTAIVLLAVPFLTWLIFSLYMWRYKKDETLFAAGLVMLLLFSIIAGSTLLGIHFNIIRE